MVYSSGEIDFKALQPADWPAIAGIYQYGINTNNATFQKFVPEWPFFNAKHCPDCRIGAFLKDELLAWAMLSPVSDREEYSGVAEVSIYLAEKAIGKGLGTRLLQKLIEASEEAGYWMLVASIFPENGASMRLHEKSGFRRIGTREKIAKLNGVWRDTVLFERRKKEV